MAARLQLTQTIRERRRRELERKNGPPPVDQPQDGFALLPGFNPIGAVDVDEITVAHLTPADTTPSPPGREPVTRPTSGQHTPQDTFARLRSPFLFTREGTHNDQPSSESGNDPLQGCQLLLRRSHLGRG